MDKLMALPLKGESFLLCYGKTRVLIDGGWNSADLVQSLAKVDPSLSRIDIVVCTHGDRDHAGGLKDFIDMSQISVGEFWLPGSWIDTVGELLYAPRIVANELVSELDEIAQEGGTRELESLEDLLDKRASRERKSALQADNDWLFNSDFFESLRVRGAEAAIFEKEAFHAFNSAKERVRYRFHKDQIPQELAQYWLELIDTASLIRSIAQQAIRHKVRVRWFDFNLFVLNSKAEGGCKGVLEPINAVEKTRRPLAGLSYWTRLSPINEESLVFFAPATINRIGVIFCGDSPMGLDNGYKQSFLDYTRQPNGLVVATAPHHGSGSNAIAYAHIKKWAEVVCWVRAGGTTKHPGAPFNQLPSSERVCTHCPRKKQKPSAVEICLCFFSCYPLVMPVRILSPRFCNCT